MGDAGGGGSATSTPAPSRRRRPTRRHPRQGKLDGVHRWPPGAAGGDGAAGRRSCQLRSRCRSVAEAEVKPAFLGRGWAFPVVAGAGAEVATWRPALRTSERRSGSSCRPSRGSGVMRPDFGAGLRHIVFEPINTATLTLVVRRVEDALTRWELRPGAGRGRRRRRRGPAGRSRRATRSAPPILLQPGPPLLPREGCLGARRRRGCEAPFPAERIAGDGRAGAGPRDAAAVLGRAAGRPAGLPAGAAAVGRAG